MSFEEVLNVLFGGQFDASKLAAIIVFIYAIVKSITEWIAKKKLLKLAAKEDKKDQELALLKEGVAKLGDIVITAYLSSNTVPVEVKRELGKLGDQLNKVAKIPLAETTTKLIEVVTEVTPNNDLIKHKEEIEEAAKTVEKVIDTANDLAQDAIDKITI